MAIVAPAAWRRVSVSPRKTTDSTTVNPPNAATIPLTTAIGPIWRPGEVGQVGARPDDPEQRRRGRTIARRPGGSTR